MFCRILVIIIDDNVVKQRLFPVILNCNISIALLYFWTNKCSPGKHKHLLRCVGGAHPGVINRNDPSRIRSFHPSHQTRKLFSAPSPTEEKNDFLSMQFHLHHCCKYNDRTPGVSLQYALNNAPGKDGPVPGLILEKITRAPHRKWFCWCGRRRQMEIVEAGLRLAFIKPA